MNLHNGDQRRVQVVSLRLLRVQYLDWVRPAGNCKDRRLKEILGELHGIERRRCHDQFEIWSLFHRLQSPTTT